MRNMSHSRKFLSLVLPLAAAIAVATPAVAHNTRSEAANKKVVLDFYKALNTADAAGTTKQQIKVIAEKYLSPEYTQHAEAYANLPGPGSARDKLIRMFQNMPAMKLPPSKTLSVMAENDLVMMLTSREMPDPATGRAKPAYIFNMFRVKNGQLAEHWDIMPSPPGAGGPGMPPPSGPSLPGMMPPGAGTPPGGE
jgi:predicted SnoaL-like aldol condensation-catalyzing enzyme